MTGDTPLDKLSIWGEKLFVLGCLFNKNILRHRMFEGPGRGFDGMAGNKRRCVSCTSPKNVTLKCLTFLDTVLKK